MLITTSGIKTSTLFVSNINNDHTNVGSIDYVLVTKNSSLIEHEWSRYYKL